MTELKLVTSNTPQEKTRVLICRGGHLWEFKRQGGTQPKTCPQHNKYWSWTFPPKYEPPLRIIKRWRTAEQDFAEEGYVARWKNNWREAVRMCAARRDSFSAIPLDVIERYVEHMRASELHRMYAEMEPYSLSKETGTQRAHPGWDRSLAEEKAAKQVAIELGFVDIPNAPDFAQATDVPKPQQGETEEEEDGGIIDDQVGPDGRPL